MNVYDFFSAHGFVAELVICTAMMVWPQRRRSWFVLRAFCSAGFLFCISILWQFFPVQNAWTMSLRYLAIFLGCALGILFCWDIGKVKTVFLAIAACALQHLAFKLGRTIAYYLYFIPVSHPVVRQLYYPLLLIPCYLILYILFARRLQKNDTEALRGGSALLLLLGMLLSIDLFQNLFDEYSVSLSIHGDLYTLFQMFGIVNCVFLLCLQGEIATSKKSGQDNAILKHLLHQQKEQMETSKETMELLNVKCHDIKNQIAMLGNRIPQETLEDLNRTISIYDRTAKTGNKALDVLVAEKSLLCEQKGIRFDYMADGTCLTFMQPADIYSMFGNALDNAIEASEKLPPSANRHIGMRVRVEKGMVLIHFENFYNGQVVFDGEFPQTSKHDKNYHGFGVKSIKMVVKKYGGNVSIKAGKELFTLNILLPLPRTFAS